MLDLAEFPYHTPALDWNLTYIYLIFPISFLLMAIRIVQVNFQRFVLGQEPVDPDQQALEERTQALVDGE
jgi:TRAP-type C4-dicarboxylate transport system permease small subunit